MKIHNRKSVLALLAVATLSVTQFVWGAKPEGADAERDARKADYIYLEGLRYRAQGKSDAYYDMVARAYELNPADDYLAKEYGVKLILESDGDSAELDRALKMVRDYAVNNPGDFYNNVLYASIASQTGRDSDAMATWASLYRHNANRPEVAAMYADQLASSGAPDDIRHAIELYDTIEGREGSSVNISARKIQLYNALRDTAAVLNEGASLLATSPQSVQYTLLMGNLYSEFGKHDSALVYYNRALELDPSSGLAYYNRANYYKTVGDSAAYDREVFNAIRQPDLDMMPKLGILQDYVRDLYSDSTQHDRITAMFQSLIEQYPHEVDVRKLYGDYLIAVKDYAGAAEQVSYAVDADPSDTQLWQMLSSLYLELGDYDKMIATSENALRYFTDNVLLYQMLATGYSNKKDYDKAIASLRRAKAAVDSTNVEEMSNVVSSIGDVYYQAEQKDSAFVYYEAALTLNPENLLALNNCAYYLACEDMDLDRALSMIKHVVEAKPEDNTSLDTYAWVLFKRKEYTEAKEMIDGALTNTDEPTGEIYEHAGDIYFMNGQPEEALDFWKKALALDPDNMLLKKKVKHKTFFYK